MPLISTLLEELAGIIAGEAVGAAAEKPFARLARGLRRRLTVSLIIAAWVIALAVMVRGWRLGVGGATGVLGWAALLFWIGAPVTALFLTGLWWHGRDA